MLSSIPFLLVLTSSTRNFKYHFRCGLTFPFLSFFSRFSSVMLSSFTLVILPLNYWLTLSIHDISGVLSSFPRIAPQNLPNFSISRIWPICFVPVSTVLKRFFYSLSELGLSITRPLLPMGF